MEGAIFRLAAMLGTTPAMLKAMLTADEKAAWLACLNNAK